MVSSVLVLLLSNLLNKASTETGDPLWQLPLWQNYNNQILSNHADYKNIGSSGFGGAITAALFLEKFIKKEIPWIHIDLMAVSYTHLTLPTNREV